MLKLVIKCFPGQEVEIIYPDGVVHSKINKIFNSEGVEVARAHGGAGLHDLDLATSYQPYGLISLKESSM